MANSTSTSATAAHQSEKDTHPAGMCLHHAEPDGESPIDSFGERLRQLRTELFGRRGQKRFAELCGIPQSSLGKYERNVSPNLDALKRIVEATGADANWLLTGDGRMFLDAASDTPPPANVPANGATGTGIEYLGRVPALGFETARPTLRIHQSIPPEMISERYFALTIADEILQPLVMENDLLIFFRLNRTIGTISHANGEAGQLGRLRPFDGCVVLATFDGHSQIRRLKLAVDTDQIMLVPCACDIAPTVFELQPDGRVFRGNHPCGEFRIDGVLRLAIRSHQQSLHI